MVTIREIAERCALRPARLGRDWRGTCPACDYPDALVITATGQGRVLAWCAACRDQEAVVGALGLRGLRRSPPPAHPIQRPSPRGGGASARQERARCLFAEARPLPGSPAERYLRGRGITGTLHDLRFHPKCPHPSKARLPALVAAVRNTSGTLVGVHRAYLRPDGGGKAAVEPQRATLGEVRGGAVRLHPPQPGRPLVLAEGVETAAAAALIFDLPAWSALSAGNLADHLRLPPELAAVVIAADNDASGIGQEAARRAARRFAMEGRTVEIATPNQPGDFNDLLLAKVAAVSARVGGPRHE